MRKVNLAYLYGITSLLHTCTHAVVHVENPISPHTNINVYLCDETWAQDPATWNSLQVMLNLAMEACCTIHENDY